MSLVEGRADLRSDPRLWAALMAGGLVYWAWNGIAVTAAIALSQGLNWWTVYRKGLLLSLLVAAGNTTTGVLLVVIAKTNPVALVGVPMLCGVLLLAYRGYIKAMRERDTWQVLQEVSNDLLQLDEEALAHVVIDGARRLFGAEFAELVIAPGGPTDAVIAFGQVAGKPMSRDHGSPFVVAAPFWGRVLADREPFQVSGRRAAAPQREELTRLGLATCAVIPLISGRGCIGCLRIGFQGDVSLGGRELQVFATYGSHVTAAVSNAQLFEEMRNLALHDVLTGLPNRSLLQDRLLQALERSRRTRTHTAVLFVDLDRFKVINDSLGHETGDQVLQAVAGRLVDHLRPGDTATRFGGDEFVVVCEGVVDAAEAQRLGDRLVEIFETPFVLPTGREAFVSASVGVVLAEAGMDDPGALLGHADAAVYRAKERGRACCALFDEALSTRVVTRLEREEELRHAIGANELHLHYQPLVRLSDQRIVGSEALLRWRHPRLGALAPAEFIPLAEETGLIVTVGTWALRL
ncbi:MAG TPA: GGDEF domain-containing protein, partial [Acidimicrobiales bacterium]